MTRRAPGAGIALVVAAALWVAIARPLKEATWHPLIDTTLAS